MTPDRIILASWAVFLLVWLGLSFFVKRDVRGGRTARSYQVRELVLVVVIVVLAWSYRHHQAGPHLASNRLSLFAPTRPLLWIGAGLAAIGVAVAIWARLYIGRNWSPRPAKKEAHELVTGGPYAVVRHPIYTGIIIAALGTALTGTILGLIVLAFAAALFLSRVRTEEQIMLELFPDAYPPYQSRTKRLIPFIW